MRFGLTCLLLLSGALAFGSSYEKYTALTGTDSGALSSKAMVLGEWADRLERGGTQLPKMLRPRLSAGTFKVGSHKLLDGYARELLLREQEPQKLGRASFVNRPTSSVGEQVNLTQVYRSGDDLAVGTSLILGRHWQHDVDLQFSNPRAPNYVRITAANATFRPALLQVDGVFGGMLGVSAQPAFKMSEGFLQAGDEVTIQYRNLSLPTVNTDEFTLPLWLDLGDGHLLEVPVEMATVPAGAAARLVVRAPSIVAPNEAFTLSVRAEDEFGNLSTGQLPSLDVLVDGVFSQRTAAGQGANLVLEGFRFGDEGIHLFEIRSGGGGLVGQSNPIVVERSGAQVRWLGLHHRSSDSSGLQERLKLTNELQGLYDQFWIADQVDYGSSHGNRQVMRPMQKGGSYLDLDDGAGLVALPEVSTDARVIRPNLLAIHTGAGSHEWFLDHFAEKGFRVGVAATDTSYSSRTLNERPATGVFLKAGQTLQAALSERQTFATTGSRGLLQMSLNEVFMGGRAPIDERREITGRIIADRFIDRIELVKNGEVIEIDRPARETRESSLRVTLFSESRPTVAGFDLPRNAREWLGYLRIEGASISGLSAPGFDMRRDSAIAINPKVPDRIDFFTHTHGNHSSFEVSLADGQTLEGATVELAIREGFEDVDYLPVTRAPSNTPGFQLRESMDQVLGPGVERSVSIDGYVDVVALSAGSERSLMESDFRFVDVDDDLPGDYYYIRVIFADDHMMWSSPIYIGGLDAEAP